MRRLAIGLLAAIVVVAGVAGVGWWQERQEQRARDAAREATASVASAFLSDWEGGNLDSLASHVAEPPPDLADRYAAVDESLVIEELAVELGAVELVDTEDPHQGGVARFEVRMALDGLGDWAYDGRLRVVRDEADRWAVAWTPATIHPELDDGERLARTRAWPDRAPILGRDGRPLTGTGTQLDGLVGTTGPITQELLEGLGDPYRTGDEVGLKGLQRAYEERLAGAPTGEVLVTGSGGQDQVLEAFGGQQPQPVRTGLDARIQRAAEAALPPSAGNAAMVVVDVRTGAIRAVVDRPAAGFRRALSGRYPPGSTFKVVTTLALLRDGTTPADTVSCPPTATVGGRAFTNFEDQAFGDIAFREAFYRSCNTAFVQLAAGLDDGDLRTAAEDLGFNRGWELPVGEPVASFPEPGDLAERAAAAFGQAKVESSPVQMAGVAAGIARGAWRSPWLTEVEERVEGPDLGPAATTITELMQEVPRIGTAAGAGLPDGVAGKTGTAEYGTGDPLPTHAWFLGFQTQGPEPLAWAVLVEGGESGGSVAAPVAARFLAELGAA